MGIFLRGIMYGGMISCQVDLYVVWGLEIICKKFSEKFLGSKEASRTQHQKRPPSPLHEIEYE